MGRFVARWLGAAAVTMVAPAVPHIAWAGELWTVQAVQQSGEVVCDAFAQGAMGRPLYEFRFRRSAKTLLLIVSYDGPALKKATKAALFLDNVSVGEFPATQARFGTRDALVISLAPGTVDFHDFERHRSFMVSTKGASFGMAPLARDRVADNMDQCIKQFVVAPAK